MSRTKIITVALEPDIYRQLKEIVFKKEMKQQDVIANAITAHYNSTIGRKKK